MDQDRIIVESFKRYIPAIKDWINDLVTQYSTVGRPVSSFGFSRLALYYPKEVLDSTKVVIIEKPPAAPLTSLGLTQFGDFEKMELGGVTYVDTYFIRPDHVHLESIHFHELVHIIQWQYLGIDKFLLLYGLGLLKYGYKNSPLETLAYNLAERFGKDNNHFDVQTNIIPVLDNMIREVGSVSLGATSYK